MFTVACTLHAVVCDLLLMHLNQSSVFSCIFLFLHTYWSSKQFNLLSQFFHGDIFLTSFPVFYQNHGITYEVIVVDVCLNCWPNRIPLNSFRVSVILRSSFSVIVNCCLMLLNILLEKASGLLFEWLLFLFDSNLHPCISKRAIHNYDRSRLHCVF